MTLKSGADLERVEKIIKEELDKVRTQPTSKDEFGRAVFGMESGFVSGLESLMARALTLQGYSHFLGTPDYISKDLERWRKSSPQDEAMAWAKRVLHPEKRVEVLTIPAPEKATKKGASDVDTEINHTTPHRGRHRLRRL